MQCKLAGSLRNVSRKVRGGRGRLFCARCPFNERNSGPVCVCENVAQHRQWKCSALVQRLFAWAWHAHRPLRGNQRLAAKYECITVCMMHGWYQSKQVCIKKQRTPKRNKEAFKPWVPKVRCGTQKSSAAAKHDAKRDIIQNILHK